MKEEDVEKSSLRVKFLFFICSHALAVFLGIVFTTPFSFLYLSIIYMLTTKKPHPIKNVIEKFTSLDNKNLSKINTACLSSLSFFTYKYRKIRRENKDKFIQCNNTTEI